MLGGFNCLSQGQDQFRPQLKYTGEDSIANISYHDGQMRPTIGAHNYQVVRANRDYPEWADGMEWEKPKLLFPVYFIRLNQRWREKLSIFGMGNQTF